MNSTFDIYRNCVKIKADIKGRGLRFRGSGVLYPLEMDEDHDYVFTAQHILKDDRKKKLKAALDKIETIEIEVFENGHFITYKTITKENILNSLLPIGEDFLIIRIDKSEKHFTPFLLADDLIEEKSMQLYGISGEAQDIITRLDCKCVNSKVSLVNITSHVDDMTSLHGMSGGGIFAQNQPLLYGVLWKYAATEGEFHNVKITQELEKKIKSQLTTRRWESLNFLNITQCKQAMCSVFSNVFRDINDSILVNRNNTQFPIEARFIMPDFISEVQNLHSEDQGKPEEKPVQVDPTNIYLKNGEIQEYSEQYLKEFYSQLNKTSSREIRIPASSILSPSRNLLLIVGGPGSGKSSLLKYLTLQLLKGMMGVYDSYLPVWLPFSYMARNCESDIKSIIRDWFQESKLWEKNSHYLEYAFEQQKILLIADGIDEWGDEPLKADRIIRNVKAEAECGNLLAIFSSREYGITNINSSFSPSDTYTIAPLSALQQDELVKKCVDHYNGLGRDTKKTVEFLSAKMRSLQDVDRMKENPMLLTILIGQYLQGNELPHNNIAAMDCIIEQLFVKHQQSRRYQAYDYSGSFDYTINKMMLGVLSKEMFGYYSDGSMDKNHAEILLNQYLNSQTSGQELNNAHIVDDFFRHETHQLGIIEERIGSRISFINRQLQEFMAAKYFSVDINRAKAFIRDNVANTALHQVVIFLFEMMPASAFVGLYNILKPINTNDYRDYYLYKLKLEILVRSVKAPECFLLEEIEEYINRIEWESDYDTKHDLLEILLDGLYNTSLKNRIEGFISRYIPSASIYHDIRLSGLAQVTDLTEDDRQFIVLTIINGDVSNKILASEVIRKHIISDEKLLKLVNSYIKPSTMPEVLAFFIRSIIAIGIDISKEEELIKSVVHGGLLTQLYQYEFSLFKGEPVSSDVFIHLISKLPFSCNEEVCRILQQYFTQDELVRQRALKSVTSHFREPGNISIEIAWKYLLTCWVNHPNVINSIAEELKKAYPFNHGYSYELWNIIQQQEISPDLRQLITEWAVCRDKKDIMWSAESLIINTIANDSRIKTKLLEALEGMTNWQHIVVSPLIKNWGQDAEVIDKLQRCLDEKPLEQSSWIAGYAYEIYQGNDERVMAYLDKCINEASDGIMKDRAVYVYIDHYKEEFAERYIPRVLNGEILMSDHILGSKWSILDAIIQNYSERQDVKEFIQICYSNDYKFAGQIIAKYHGSELASRMLKKWYHMDTRLRLMMIHKVSNLSSLDENIERMLHLFNQEGNAYVLCDMVLCLANHLKRTGRDAEVFKVAEEVFNTTQVTTEYAYKIRFCIYLMYHKLDEYVQLNIKTGGKEYEFAQFHIFHNDSPYIEKVIVDEAGYLLADYMANLKKIAKADKAIYSYIVFFSKYVSPTSQAADVIVRYLKEYKDKIDDANILLFLMKMRNQQQLLKELVMANINNTHNEMSATVAQIIVNEFDKDEDIKQLLKLDDFNWQFDFLNRISINCSLYSNVDKLKEIFNEAKANKYELDNSYASYNFVLSMMDENKFIENLKYYMTELQDTFVYRIIVNPLLVRLKRDKRVAEKLYEELLQTEDPRIKMGIYSILSSAGIKSAELRDWRELQHQHLDEYGHDIVLNRDRKFIAIMQ